MKKAIEMTIYEKGLSNVIVEVHEGLVADEVAVNRHQLRGTGRIDRHASSATAYCLCGRIRCLLVNPRTVAIDSAADHFGLGILEIDAKAMVAV